MSSKRKPSNKGFSRGKFLRFLGGIGLLSLIPGLPASAEERKFETLSPTRLQSSDSLKILKSPTIKGQFLSNDVLTAKLSTKNLENIRDLLTGRFFGRVAESTFKDGYVPLIKWNLGGKGSDNGCFFYVKVDPQGMGPGEISNCSWFVNAREDGKMIFLDIYNISAIPEGPLNLGGIGALASDCGSHCVFCSVQCSGGYSGIDLYEVASYPADKFVSELTDILKTTDIDKIQKELKAVIFSDEVLNMGLQHFVTAAYDGMIDAT